MILKSSFLSAAICCMAIGMLYCNDDDDPKETVVLTEKQQALLDADPTITKSTAEFDREIKVAESELKAAKTKAAAKRLEVIQQQLKSSTQTGDFDKAIACKALIEGLEEIGIDGSRPRPRDTIKFGGHTYALIKDPATTWHLAKARCEEMGGHLVCLESKVEAAFVTSHFRPEPNGFWCGATDEKSEGIWLWTTGERVNHRVISKDKFNNFYEGEHYLRYFYDPDSKSWIWDDAGSARLSFVCEWNN